VPDIHVDDVGQALEALVPDVLDDHGAGEHAARMGGEVFEERVLLRGELDGFAGALHIVREAVHLEIADTQDTRTAHGPAAQQCFHADEQFGEGEWLGEVVIGASLEVLHLFFCGITGCQDENRNLLVLTPDPAQDFGAAQDRQHEIENDEVVVIGVGQGPTGLAVGGYVDRIALRLQRPLDEVAEFLLVFYEQYSHGGFLP
jgi:hypothetical protein